MNLKEKIQTILIEDSGNLQKICFIEDLADQHAIDFAEWMAKEYWLNSSGKYMKGQTHKELLEIYKKEKGL